jgi:hypothetical protein
LLVDTAHFGGSQFRPVQALGDEIVAAVTSNVEKGFIRLNDPTVRTPDEDTDDVGIDQATYSRLPSLEFDEKFDEADRYGNHREQNDQPAEVAMKSLHGLHCFIPRSGHRKDVHDREIGHIK